MQHVVSTSPTEDSPDGVASPGAAGIPAEAAPVEAAWQAVLDGWEDPGAHERFLALCEAMGVSAEAGARYRSLRESDPARAAEAQKRLDQLVARALARLQLERSEVSPRPRRWLFLLAVLATICLLTAATRMMLA